MPGQFLLPHSSGQAATLSSGVVSYSRNRRTWTAGRRWLSALANTLKVRNAEASRLLAALHTDMVGYSRLFARDDVGLVARLRELRRTVFMPAIRRHRGRLVQTAGDSMLIIFDSVVQAVGCAVAIQDMLHEKNQFWPPDLHIRLRMGVDLGDILADGTDFHGDGVIIAARLQALCPPGGVCVSRAVHDRSADRLGLPFERLGPLVLKNLERPVEAVVLWPSGRIMEQARLLDHDS